MTSRLARAAGSDTSKEVGGVPVDYCPDGETHFRCVIARAGGSNDLYHKALEEATRSFRNSGVDLSRVDHTKQRGVMASVYAKSVIKGWNDEDFETPFSVEAAEAFFLDVPDFLDFCVVEANKIAAYRKAAIGAVSGN